MVGRDPADQILEKDQQIVGMALVGANGGVMHHFEIDQSRPVRFGFVNEISRVGIAMRPRALEGAVFFRVRPPQLTRRRLKHPRRERAGLEVLGKTSSRHLLGGDGSGPFGKRPELGAVQLEKAVDFPTLPGRQILDRPDRIAGEEEETVGAGHDRTGRPAAALDPQRPPVATFAGDGIDLDAVHQGTRSAENSAHGRVILVASHPQATSVRGRAFFSDDSGQRQKTQGDIAIGQPTDSLGKPMSARDLFSLFALLTLPAWAAQDPAGSPSFFRHDVSLRDGSMEPAHESFALPPGGRELELLPTSSTPYDRYFGSVRAVIASMEPHRLTMSTACHLMKVGHSFEYRSRDPYRPDPPKLTEVQHAGDCKSKALWLFDSLSDSGALFVIGKAEKNLSTSHAWVYWRCDGRWWILDCTDRADPIAADTVSPDRYVPYYSFGKLGVYRHPATKLTPTSGAAVAANSTSGTAVVTQKKAR